MIVSPTMQGYPHLKYVGFHCYIAFCYMNILQFVDSSLHRHLECFQVGIITNNAVMNILLLVCLFMRLGWSFTQEQNFWILGYASLQYYRLLLALNKCSHFPQPCLYLIVPVFLILAILGSVHLIAFWSVFSQLLMRWSTFSCIVWSFGYPLW